MKEFKEKTEWIFWTTIAISFVLLEHNGTEPLFLFAYSLIPLLVLIFYYKRSFWTVVFYLLFFGFFGRFTRYYRGVYASDVLPTIKDFIGYFLAGKNVYKELVAANTGIIPFVYLPFTIYWYIPARLLQIDFRFFEMLVSGFVPILFFLSSYAFNNRWKILPMLSVIALTPFLLDLSADGSNDNSAIFLLLSSIAFTGFSIRNKSKKMAILSAVFLGFAISFKQYTFFYFLFLIPFAFKNKNFLPISFKKYFLYTMLTFGIIALPFILRSPPGFFKNLIYVEVANQANHPFWGWNIWVAIKLLFNWTPNIQQLWLTRTILTATTILAFFRFLKFDNFNKVFVASSISILVYLMFSQWTTYAYFTFLVPLICLAGIGIEEPIKSKSRDKVRR